MTNENEQPQDKPISELEQLLTQARNVVQQITDEQSRITQQTSEVTKQVQELHSEYEKLSGEVKALRHERDALQEIVSETNALKSSVEESKNAVVGDVQIISQTKEQFEEIKTQTKTASDDLNTRQGEVAGKITEINQQIQNLTSEYEQLSGQVRTLKDERDTLQELVNETKQLKSAAEEAKNSVLNDVQNIGQTKQQFEEMKAQAQTLRDDLNNRQGEVAGKISEINNDYDRIKREQAILFDDRADDKGVVTKGIVKQIHDANVTIKSMLDENERGGETTKQSLEKLIDESKLGLETVVSDFNKNLGTLTQQSTTQVQDLKAALEAEIRSLLPGAGAAGLASTYVEAKSRYAPSKFEYTGSKKEDYYLARLFGCWLWHGIRTSVVPCVFYAMFLLPLVFITYNFYELFDILKDHPDASHKDLWLYRGAVSLPLATISWFGWSSIRLYRRLYEEYNHKQRVMQLYHSFKKEIEEHGGTEHQQALLGVMLTAVGDKPSLAMHRYDRGMEELWPNLSIGGVLASIIKGKKESP